MAINTYKIRVKVTLHSYLEGGKKLDLTPWIKTINTDKNINNPSGSFQITLLPVTEGENNLSWYYRVTPMDYVEIRFTRDSTLTKIPIVMRGFVDSITRTAMVDQNGSPLRGYTITGRDFGKIFELTRIYYLKEVMADVVLLGLPDYEKLKEKYEAKIEGSPVNVIGTILGIAQNQLGLISDEQSYIPSIEYIGSSTINGYINQFSLTMEDGSAWDLMRYFDNTPWNELFILDLDDAPALVFRETPWKDFDNSNEYIQSVDETVETYTLEPSIEIESSSIQSFNLSRSDNELKNYFFTYPSQIMLNTKTSFKAYALGEVKAETDLHSNPYLIDREDGNAGLNRFGFRRFENTSEYFSESFSTAETAAMAKELNLALVKAFKYNGLYESGTFTIKGNATARPGRYVTFQTNRSIDPEFYVAGVTHDLSLQEGSEHFITTLTVQRGDGFLKTRKQIDSADVDYK